ncbi:MAG TPA: hypothetical protein VF834_05135 [Streptosporangiaceae bacterium]
MRRHYAQALQAVWLTGVVMVTLGTGPASPPGYARGAAVTDGITKASGVAGTSAARASGAGARLPGVIPACRFTCRHFFSRKPGSSQVMTVLAPGGAGQDLYLGPAQNAGANGDFIASQAGRVFQFCGVTADNFFLSSSYVCKHYPDSSVYELVWSPAGNETGLCAGVAQAGVSGESVTLQACGLSAATTWIFDSLHKVPGTHACTALTLHPVTPGGKGHFCPLVSGGDTESTDPLVLTAAAGPPGTSSQLEVSHELLTAGVASDAQQFAAYSGPPRT